MEKEIINSRLRSRVDESSKIFLRRKSPSDMAPVKNFPSETINKNEEENRDYGFMVKILDKLISGSVALLFFGLPLFFTGLSFQGVIFEKQLFFYFFLLLALVSWAAKGVITGEMSIRRTPLDIPILGFWLAYILATVFSIDRWHSFWGSFGDPSRGLMGVSALIIAYYLILSNFSFSKLRLYLIAFLSSSFILSLATALIFLGINFVPEKMAAYFPLSLVGSVTGLGIFFSTLLPIIVLAVLKIAESNFANRFLKTGLLISLMFFFFLDVFLILALYNFIPWAGIFIGVVLFLVFILSKMVRPKPSWTWLPMVMFILVMVLKMVGELPIVKVNLPIEVSLNYPSSLELSKDAIKENFFLGSGPGTYGYNFSLNRSTDFNQSSLYSLRFSQGTGILMEAIPTIGSIGTFFLIILALSFVSIQGYLLYKEREKNKLYSLALFCGALIIIIDIFAVRAEGTMLILGCLLGILSLATAMEESDGQKNYLDLSLKASPKFALALAFIFMVVSAGVAFLFVFLGKVYAADIYAGKSVRLSSQGQEEESINKLGQAIRLNNREGRYFIQLGQYYMMLANKEALLGEQRDVQKIQQYLNFSINATRQGNESLKNDVTAQEALAQIYENTGLYVVDSLNLAKEAYEKALELEPHNPNFYERIGQIKISLAAVEKDEAGKKKLIEEAKEMFQKSVEEKNNFEVGYYQLSLVQEALGETDQAVENGLKAVQLNPRNANYLFSLARIYQSKGGEENYKNAEDIYKLVISLNDKDVNARFYLGLLYEKTKKKTEAKEEYKKVLSLLPEEGNEEIKKQLEKMISNVEQGIENTPKSLGLVKEEDSTGESQSNSSNEQNPSDESSESETSE